MLSLKLYRTDHIMDLAGVFCDHVSLLCSIFQNGQPIECYVEEFLLYRHLMLGDEAMVKDCFWSGIDPNICLNLLEDSSCTLAQFIEFVLQFF